MAQDLYGFDEQSARRIGAAVRSSESNQQGGQAIGSRGVDRLQVYTFVRETPTPLDSVVADSFSGTMVSTEYEYDFDALTVTCESPRVEIPEDAPWQTINHASLIEGCVFHGDIFQAVNIGGKWHAIGTAHTAIKGVYSSADGTLTVDDCNSETVPVQVALTGFELTDGETYVAEWIRAARVYVVTISGCEEE